MTIPRLIKGTIFFWFCLILIAFSDRSNYQDQTNYLHGLLKCETRSQGFTLNYYYDNERQLISIPTKYRQETTYDYYDNFIVKKEITSSVVWYIDTLFYNPTRLIGYSKRYMKRGKEDTYDLLAVNQYSYNNDKYLTEWRIIHMYVTDDTSRIFQFTIEDGNVKTEKSFEKNKPDKSTMTEYTYFPDKINSLGNSFTGTSFLGMSSKNPVRELKKLYPGNKMETHSYQYQYDNGIIIKMTDNGETTSYEYY
jgi:hypothetical protein